MQNELNSYQANYNNDSNNDSNDDGIEEQYLFPPFDLFAWVLTFFTVPILVLRLNAILNYYHGEVLEQQSLNILE